MAWYVVRVPSPDGREGTAEVVPLYASMKEDRWEFNRIRATYWFKREKAEAAAATIALRKPEHVGHLEVQWFKLPGYGR